MGTMGIGNPQAKGSREENITLLLLFRKTFFSNVNAALPNVSLQKLTDADAFRSKGLDRRQALWEVSTKHNPKALFKRQAAQEGKDESV